jgi:hypothetical protein
MVFANATAQPSAVYGYLFTCYARFLDQLQQLGKSIWLGKFGLRAVKAPSNRLHLPPLAIPLSSLFCRAPSPRHLPTPPRTLVPAPSNRRCWAPFSPAAGWGRSTGCAPGWSRGARRRRAGPREGCPQRAAAAGGAGAVG